METVMDSFFLGAQITANGDYSKHQKTLAPWKKSYDKCRQRIKKQRHHFADNTDVRVGPLRRLSAEELMLSNCGAGEDSSESLGQQGN